LSSPAAEADLAHRASADRTFARLTAVVLCTWAVASLFSEGLQQGALYAAIVLALVARRRVRLARDVKLVIALAVAVWLWQLTSPLLAVARHLLPGMPRSGRYGQAFDTLAPAAVAALATFGVPWRALASALGVGWALDLAAGVFQHAVPWPFGDLHGVLTAAQLHRLRQNVDRPGHPPARAGLGLFFHRLRFAHGAVAALGPALAVATRSAHARARVWAGALSLALLCCALVSYTRAALGAGLAMAVLALATVDKRQVRAAAVALTLAAAAAIAVSPTWRARIADVPRTMLRGERELAMTTGMKIIEAHPLLGVGFGNYKPSALPLQRVHNATTTLLSNDAHDLVLTVWAETGLLGLSLYLAFHLALARALWGRARRGSLPASGALLSLLGFHVLGLVHYIAFHTGVMLSFGLFWGLGLAPHGPGDSAAS